MQTPKGQLPQLTAALALMKTAQDGLNTVMTALHPVDIYHAFQNYGYEGMRPATAKFKSINPDDDRVYECAWWDDSLDDGTMIVKNVYVWYDLARNKLMADI